MPAHDVLARRLTGSGVRCQLDRRLDLAHAYRVDMTDTLASAIAWIEG